MVSASGEEGLRHAYEFLKPTRDLKIRNVLKQLAQLSLLSLVMDLPHFERTLLSTLSLQM
jgi:hypothetical protein